MKNILTLQNWDKLPNKNIILTMMFLYSLNAIGHSQQLDTFPHYRTFGSQYLENLIGVNRSIKDSLYNDIEHIEPNAIPEILSYELKIHNLCSSMAINASDVEEQVGIINSAFQILNGSQYVDNETINAFYLRAAIPNINFCFDPGIAEGNFTDQIELNSKILNTLNQISPMPEDKRLINIYVVDLKGQYAGMATTPVSNSKEHGIIIDYRFFGINEFNYPNYNEGKTMVHLLASFLGLSELWNEVEPCADDNVEDTPIHNYANFTAGTDYKNVSTCDGHPLEMIVNYMDNLPDHFMTMFTTGQSEWMRKMAFSKFGRKELLTNGCYNQSEARVSKVDLKLYPNPNSGEFSLIPSKKMYDVKIQLYDVMGMPVYNRWFQEIDNVVGVTIDISQVPAGIYIVEIIAVDQQHVLRKIIKQ